VGMLLVMVVGEMYGLWFFGCEGFAAWGISVVFFGYEGFVGVGV